MWGRTGCAALLVVLCWGCEGEPEGTDSDAGHDTDTCVPGEDTGCFVCTWGAATLIDYVESGCTGSSTDRWITSADTVGWTSDARLNMSDTANAIPWDEEHTLESVAFGSNGYWDLVERRLTTGASTVEFTPDVNTVFGCAVHDGTGVMTFAIRVYDPDGQFADCATWGHDPSGVIDGTYAAQADDNGVNDASELASCIIF